MGLMYLLSPLISGFFAWYPNTLRRCIIIGLIIMCLSLGLSSLSQTVPHLIASQGVFYAIGGALCYVPVVAFMEQWFVKRKGLAFGIMWVCLHLRTSFASWLFLGKYSCSFSLSTDSVTGWHWYRRHHNSPTTAIPPW